MLWRWRVAARIALGALRSNPVRAALAMLGVIIGAGALVAVLAVSDGVEAFARSRISRQGFDRLTVRPVIDDIVDGQVIPRLEHATFEPGDLDSIQPFLRPIERATLSRQSVIVWPMGFPSRERAVSVREVAFSQPDSLGYRIVRGRMITPAEARSVSPVAVINPALARALLGDAESSGAMQRIFSNQVSMGNVRVKIVGLIATESETRPGTLSLVVPLGLVTESGFEARSSSVAGIGVVTARAEEARSMRTRVEKWLTQKERDWRERYRIEARAESQLAEMQTGMLIFRLLMGSITGITLLVSGIGIMNVLLAAVAERTREIGVRKAVGARRDDILLQFVAEAVAITSAGGVIGVLFGLASAYAITALMRSRTHAEVYAATTLPTLLITLALTLFLGIASGGYPALRAARLAPVDAIHRE